MAPKTSPPPSPANPKTSNPGCPPPAKPAPASPSSPTATRGQHGDDWHVPLPGEEPFELDDPRSAPNQARELIGNQLGITDFLEREKLDVVLVDSSGQQVHAFLLLFVPLAARPGDY